jgi:hypothetical protein
MKPIIQETIQIGKTKFIVKCYSDKLKSIFDWTKNLIEQIYPIVIKDQQLKLPPEIQVVIDSKFKKFHKRGEKEKWVYGTMNHKLNMITFYPSVTFTEPKNKLIGFTKHLQDYAYVMIHELLHYRYKKNELKTAGETNKMFKKFVWKKKEWA